ncbi:hypothetical protein DPEC_G00230280 [Dallia pectoralis]|uniref:Uncharacterized protein n=1 Tax=Dallia pectoralis TaxID=75939 RepID=A0ACC2G203_DALPE|nr:hypothetical protein DPEC_G00230280 [Dallia pectoralis]
MVTFPGRQNATQTFMLVKEYKTWYQAQSFCRTNYTDLAIVRNQAENQAIRNLTQYFSTYLSYVGNQTVNQTYSNYNQVWIGLYRDASWSDGSNSSNLNYYYNYYYYGNYYGPDVGLNESCVALPTNGYYYLSPLKNCNVTLPFICYSEQCSFSLNTSHQYHLVNMNKNWTEAQSFCRETYTDLATITDPEEYNSVTCQINSTLGSSGRAWIGLKYNWRWSLENNETEGISSGWPGGYPWVQNVYMTGRQNATQAFVLVKEYKTWNQAQSYCRDYYTDLAIVRNQAENQAIRNLTQYFYTYLSYVGNQTVNQTYTSYNQVWIGLYRDIVTWSDGSNSSNFISVQGINQSCFTAKYDLNYQYYTETCSDRLPFVCYTATNSGPRHVVVLKMKLSSLIQLTDYNITNVFLPTLHDEIIRRGLPEIFTLRLRTTQEVSP